MYHSNGLLRSPASESKGGAPPSNGQTSDWISDDWMSDDQISDDWIRSTPLDLQFLFAFVDQ